METTRLSMPRRQQLARELLRRGIVEGGMARPAMGLRVDIGEQFGERREFYESVEGEVDGVAVPGDDGGWGRESLDRDLLGMHSAAEK